MKRAGVAAEFHMAWRMPRGLSAYASGPDAAVSSPTSTPISPVRTWTQTSFRWVCGGMSAPGGMVSSRTAMTPPVCSARTRTTTSNLPPSWSPPSGPMRKDIARIRGAEAGQARIEEAVISAFISFDTIVIRYEHAGSGEPVLLLHGFPVDSRVMAQHRHRGRHQASGLPVCAYTSAAVSANLIT
jgi:hypothetical protein